MWNRKLASWRCASHMQRPSNLNRLLFISHIYKTNASTVIVLNDTQIFTVFHVHNKHKILFYTYFLDSTCSAIYLPGDMRCEMLPSPHTDKEWMWVWRAKHSHVALDDKFLANHKECATAVIMTFQIFGQSQGGQFVTMTSLCYRLIASRIFCISRCQSS